MSEPKIEKPPKPYSKTSYVFLTTLWAFLLPFLVIHLPLLLLFMTNGAREGILFFFCAVAFLAYCVFFVYRGWNFRKRFSANHQLGQVPGSFALWILPFWIPLFWGLAASAIGFYFAPLSLEYYGAGAFFGFPQYFFLYIGAAISGNMESFMAFASIANFCIAVAGTVYIARIAPPVAKERALILYSIITLFLCSLVGLAYKHFRTEILPYSYDRSVVMREEGNRNHFGSDTDLSEHIPFTENNKLVKIESPTLTIDSEHPGIHGAFALYPVYAAAVEAIYRNTGEMKFDPEYGAVRSGTSPGAFGTLLDDNKQYRYDMIFMARPSAKQLQEAADKGVELVITPIGYEAFVFFVSTVNPVDDLTLDQIRDIYSKKITRWNDIGGKNEQILPFQRPEGSGSQTAMERLMGDVPMAPPQREEFREGMGGIVASVADYRNYGNAIGFSFRYYVEGLYKHDGVKLLKINGIAPTIDNIQNGTYPLIGEMVIISRADNTNSNVPKLTEWFLSPQGQELVRDVGYVPKQ